MADQMTSGTALYYPALSPNPDWLKVSLLYWDRVRRIVPRGIEGKDRDRPEIEEAVATGFLLNTYPDDYVKGAQSRFAKQFAPLLKKQRGYGTITQDKIHELLVDGPTHSIHIEKLSYILLQELRELMDAKPNDGWVELPEQIAAPYMVCLASEMSSRIHAPMITDDQGFVATGEYALFGSPRKNRRRDRESVLLHLGFNLPTALSLHNVPIKKLLSFHEKYSDERRRFRHAIEGIVADSSDFEDPRAFEDYLADRRREINEASIDFKKSRDELRVKAIVEAADITTPSGLGVLAGLAMTEINPILGGAIAAVGLTVKAVGWWADMRGADRQAVQSNPWCYVNRVGQFKGHRRSLP